MTELQNVSLRAVDSRDMPAETSSIDLVVTSPPFNLDVDYDNWNDDLSDDGYASFLREVFAGVKRVLTPDGRFAVNIGLDANRPSESRRRLIERIALETGLTLRDQFIWDKGCSSSTSAWGSFQSSRNPRSVIQHEHILVFYNEQPMRQGAYNKHIPKNRFLELVQSVWRIKPETRDIEHPCPFPKEIPRRLIQLYSERGDVVLDPFCGAGTTCVAAAEEGRRAVGYDVSSEYIEVARNRIESISGSGSMIPHQSMLAEYSQW